MALPNFLYIGPDKAGSTWIFQVLAWHPEVYMTPAKDVGFFDDHFERGVAWYERHFDQAAGEPVVGEVSHNYLFSPEAARRIADTLPGAKVMVCLREPVDRAFSAYLYLLKHGLFTGSFEEAVEAVPELLDNGRYATHLAPYLDLLGRDRVLVSLFDDLEADSEAFARQLFAFLGVRTPPLPEELRGKSLAAARSRSVLLSKALKHVAMWAREVGLVEFVGRVKNAPVVHKLLYQPYGEDEKPRPSPATVQRLRRAYYDEVAALDDRLGTRLRERWQYHHDHAAARL